MKENIEKYKLNLFFPNPKNINYYYYFINTNVLPL